MGLAGVSLAPDSIASDREERGEIAVIMDIHTGRYAITAEQSMSISCT
jgi:hypothetical protein